MLSYRTVGFNGYGVRYSPYFDNKLAVATAANYGLVGNGKLFILGIDPAGQIREENAWETQDGLFDVAWSESHENQVAVASGDGSVRLFDVTVPRFPVMSYNEHSREVFSVNWNLVDRSTFASSSWDGCVKVWAPERRQSLRTLSHAADYTTTAAPVAQTAKPAITTSHTQPAGAVDTSQCVYRAAWSPHSASTLVSCTGASHVHVWDMRAAKPLQLDFVAHSGLECLAVDWNRYKPTVIATGGTDKAVRIWDLRMITSIDSPSSHSPMPAYHMRGPTPMNELLGHDFAVRNVAWSPHSGRELLSVSYDMTARVWTDTSDERARFLNNANSGCRGVMNQHREFVLGCDYSLWGEPGWAVSTGWDEMVHVWDTKRL